MISLVRKTKFRVGNKRIPVDIFASNVHYYLKAPYDKGLVAEVKEMQGAKWLGFDEDVPTEFKKTWRVAKNSRNNFAFSFLEELKPYARYEGDAPLIPKENFHRPVFFHQIEMVSHGLYRRQCILSCEMGTGKTLAAIEIIERSGSDNWWFVGTKSSLASVRLDFGKWRSTIWPEFLTYDELKKRLREWVPGVKPPIGVIFDESSKVKTPSSQRSQTAFYLSEQMRQTYGDQAYIILMSGSPAPKSPADWYWQVEITCPGFFREGTIDKFKNRLAVIQKVTGIDNVSFPKLLAWRDGNPNLCNICAKEKENLRHTDVCDPDFHAFEPLANEVHRLYQRMKGLTLVRFKKDCLDLPDKMYKQIRVKATPDMLRAAKLVLASSRSTIEALTRMRELSDGFQYRETFIGEETCSFCSGSRIRIDEDSGDKQACEYCNGTGKLRTMGRETIPVDAPKLEALKDELDNFDEDGRIVIYAGFTASIDRICESVNKLGWHFIRVDGRGWTSTFGQVDNLRMLETFQNKVDDKKIAFIGHPGSAGMGLTLTASSAIIYYSNDFNAESRIQSEDRIHRVGMDVNRGALIIDMLCLPSDDKVLENLKRKRELQDMTLGELKTAMENFDGENFR